MFWRIMISIALLLLAAPLQAQVCQPQADGLACESVTCPNPTDECQPVCVSIDAQTGAYSILECTCDDPSACHAELQTGAFSPCNVPDNGSGTADLPPAGCEYRSPNEVWMIIDGLPPGTTIEMDGIIMDYFNIVTGTGGSLNGEYQQFEATLDLTVTGTGDLAGYNRHLAVPIALETHSARRYPGDPVQSFMTDLYMMQGELFGDPDFCTFRVTAGTDFGLPSPGQTTLRQLPNGDFAVESFFDVYYQIEFEGCPGSPLEDYMGTTTATIRINCGILPPLCAGDCPSGYQCEQTAVVNTDFTIDYCCQCVAEVCEPLPNGNACREVTCAGPGEVCWPVAIQADPVAGFFRIADCDCIVPTGCRVVEGIGVYTTCTQPDNGSGTIDLPPIGCQYHSPIDMWMIIDGLPAGSTIEMDGILEDFINVVVTPGGSLGGEIQEYQATLDLTVTGYGELAGFNRHLSVPVALETHSAPRSGGSPLQTFETDLFELQGELFGDPDFCTFKIRGGTSLGLPSPGQTILTQLPSGDFAVESFFDVTYQIEFEGCPGSQLMDYLGTTTGTIQIATGLLTPVCVGDCPPGETCELHRTVNGDGTIDFFCQCVPLVCEPTADGSACRQNSCPNIDDQCAPTCLAIDPNTGQITVDDCACMTAGDCYIQEAPGLWSACAVPDNGSGTADLPPVGCEYQSPDEVWLIIDGLPPATTIELDGPIEGFTNLDSGPGGSLGGEFEIFDATLDLTVSGTGDLAGFNRHLWIPISCETHSAPRNPGDPIQSFQADFFTLQGELFGDPDFCTFRIRGGTDFGLPSPGHTTLRQLPSGDFAVESFFDITYQIEFEGCPGSQLMDYMGTTTGTIRVNSGILEPICAGSCAGSGDCELSVALNEDGTIQYCCACVGNYVCGDANNDGIANITDAVYLIQYIFNSGPEPVPYIAGDANCDTIVNITDAVYLIQYIFGGGPEPCDPNDDEVPDC